MPRVTGLLDYFPRLYEVAAEKIAASANQHTGIRILENRLGNKVLYPQTIPVSSEEFLFDLVLLKEALKLHSADYYNQNLRKVFIPEGLLERFPNLQKLAWVFVDAFKPPDICAILLRSQALGIKNLGTFIKVEVVRKEDEIGVWVDGKKYKIKAGCLATLPASGNKMDIRFESPSAKLLGKHEIVTEVSGGELGLMIDSRRDI